MLAFLIFLSIVLITGIGFLIKWIIELIHENDVYSIIISSVNLLFMIPLLFVIIFTMFTPHHGANPSIKDVPNEAHIDTIKTICGNDTTITYEIKWNE